MSDFEKLINASDLIEWIMEAYPDWCVGSVRSIVDHVEGMPSAQTEWRKGKWIRNDNGTYSCSVCQSWIPEEQYCYSRYCLYCGCQMEGDV